MRDYLRLRQICLAAPSLHPSVEDLAALGLAVSTEDQLGAIAGPSLAAAYVAHTRTPVDADRIVAALAAADRIGRSV